tara:strand:+ start:70 stop:300 length:231 start_codon:yes stop_codon:yes gene_type:complete
MSLQMDNLTLDNVSFGQELESTFDGDDFEARSRRPIRNSRRRGSKAITRGKARVRRARANVRKAQTALRRLRNSIR